jgi:hypothetical protein
MSSLIHDLSAAYDALKSAKKVIKNNNRKVEYEERVKEMALMTALYKEAAMMVEAHGDGFPAISRALIEIYSALLYEAKTNKPNGMAVQLYEDTLKALRKAHKLYVC